MHKLPALVLIIISIAACYEPQDGCLDPNAVNYDVSADINANCIYPQLSISFAHNWGDTTFSYDSTYLDTSGSPYQIKFMGFFLRNFEVEVDGSFVPVSDKKVRVRLRDGTFYEYPEEVVFVESKYFNAGIDSITVFDNWSAVHASVGLNELENADSASLGSNHPLNIRNSMSPSGRVQYYDYVISILPDTSDTGSQRWIYSTFENPFQLEFMVQGIFEPGMNADFIFDLYYDRLFEGFEKGMTDDEIRMMWEENVGSAMELRE